MSLQTGGATMCKAVSLSRRIAGIGHHKIIEESMEFYFNMKGNFFCRFKSDSKAAIHGPTTAALRPPGSEIR